MDHAMGRLSFFDKGEPGFGIWLGNFRDLLVDEAANKLISDFAANKIRDRVHDKALAEKLIPNDHGFGYETVFALVGTFHVAAFGLILLTVRRVEPLPLPSAEMRVPARTAT